MAIRAAIGAFPVLLLGGCSFAEHGLLAPAGPVASAQLQHLVWISLAVLIVVVPVFGFVPWVAWRYRLGNKEADYRPDWTFSLPLEVLIWGVPVLIVAGLGWMAWRETHRQDPYRALPAAAPPLEVEVIGLDWKWVFIYPSQGVATVDRLVVPAGRDVAFRITADGPMMSFMVPRLGGQVYAMAGMTTQLHLEADGPGTFEGLNTQYNGTGFAKQRFEAVALKPADFDAWVTQAKRGPALDGETYTALAGRSVPARPIVFGRVDPGLMRSVVARYRAVPQAKPAQ